MPRFTVGWIAAFVLIVLNSSVRSDEWSVVPLTLRSTLEAAFGRATLTEFALCRDDPERWFAVSEYGNLYRRDGQHWYREWEFVATFVDGAASAFSPQTVQFARGTVVEAWATWDDSILRTTDFGDTWITWAANVPGSPIESWHPDPADLSRGFVCTRGVGGGVFLTTDAGANWSRRGTGLPGAVGSLAMSPTDSDRLLAGTNAGLALSVDAGGAWQLVSPGDPASNVQFDASGTTALAFQSRLRVSVDGGATWAPLGQDPPAGAAQARMDPVEPKRMVATSTEPDSWFVKGTWMTGHRGFLHRTTDGGASWYSHENRHGRPGDSEVITTLEMYDGQIFSGYQVSNYSSGSLTRSDLSRYADWDYATRGLIEIAVQQLDVGSDGTVYAWVADSLESAMRYTNANHPDGEFWEGRRRGRFVRVGTIEVSQTLPGEIMVCGTGWVGDGQYRVWLNNEWGGGVWWVGSPYFRAHRNHGSGNTIYVWSRHWWDDGLGDLVRVRGRFDERTTVAEGIEVPEITIITPESDEEAFGAYSEGAPVRRTTDGGATWQKRSHGLPTEPITTMLMDPFDGDHLLLVYRSGVPWESTDRGATWAPHSGGEDGSGHSESPFAAELNDVDIVAADWDVYEGKSQVFLATDLGVWITGRGHVSTAPYFGVPSKGGTVAYSKFTGLLFYGGIGLYSFPVEPLAGPPPGADEPVAAPVSTPPEFGGLRLHPNPFRDAVTIEFAPLAGSPATLNVYDVTGRSVRTWTPIAGATTRTWTWDGRDAAGRPVSPGVYFVRLHSGDAVRSERVVRLR